MLFQRIDDKALKRNKKSISFFLYIHNGAYVREYKIYSILLHSSSYSLEIQYLKGILKMNIMHNKINGKE